MLCLRLGQPATGVSVRRPMSPCLPWARRRCSESTFWAAWAEDHLYCLLTGLGHTGKLLSSPETAETWWRWSSWSRVVLSGCCLLPFHLLRKECHTRNAHHSYTHDNVLVTHVCKSCKFFVVVSCLNTNRCNQWSPWKINMSKGAFAFKTHLNLSMQINI